MFDKFYNSDSPRPATPQHRAESESQQSAALVEYSNNHKSQRQFMNFESVLLLGSKDIGLGLDSELLYRELAYGS